MTVIFHRLTTGTSNICNQSFLSRVAPVIFKVFNGPNTSQHKFHHPPLTDHERRYGCRLGIDSWADTSCAGRHAHVLEFVEGRSVTAHGFATSLPSIDNLSIANVAYAYDSPSGETYILVVNNSIYLGSLMDDSLLNPIQCLLNGIRIDIRPQAFTPDCYTAQSVTILSLDVALPVEYDGVLPFLSVRRPSQRELQECTHIEITSGDAPWDPHDAVSNVLQVNITKCVESVIGNTKHPLYLISQPDAIYFDAFGDDRDVDDNAPYPEEMIDFPTAEQNDAYFAELDENINRTVLMPDRDSTKVLAGVKGRKRDHAGDVIGKADPNPILDSQVYELEFPDGRIEEYAFNTIAEALYDQVDDDGYDIGIFDEIIGHRCDPAVAISSDNGTYTDASGFEKPVVTTKGWDIQINWKDGSINWLPLATVKESNPVLTAEYAYAHSLQDEPAFKWWVRKVMKKRDRIIKKVQSQCRKGRLKFGVEVPKNMAEAKMLDAKNGNRLWQDAVQKEFDNARVAFKLLGEGERAPPTWKEITCHLVFDVKFDLRRKARYVAGGHLTKDPGVSTYASVVSRESVRIRFLLGMPISMPTA